MSPGVAVLQADSAHFMVSSCAGSGRGTDPTKKKHSQKVDGYLMIPPCRWLHGVCDFLEPLGGTKQEVAIYVGMS